MFLTMNNRRILSVILGVGSVLAISADTVKLHVIGEKEGLLGGVSCTCTSLPDSTVYCHAITDDSGFLELEVPETDWSIDFCRDGYDTFRMSKSAYLESRECLKNHRILNIDTKGLPFVVELHPAQSALK